MTCPKCLAEFDPEARACPECGVTVMRNISGVMKTSAVLIAAGDEQKFYRSVQDVPEPMRSRLLESTHSANSGTIVIADRAGKDQLTQVIARRETAKERNAQTPDPAVVATPPDLAWHTLLSGSLLGYRWIVWAGVLLFLAAAIIIAAVFAIHA